MTNLERVRDFAALFLDETGVRVRAHEVLDIIDTHLKEDADWHKTTAAALMQAERELAELREAVRREASDPNVVYGPQVSRLIEEKA